MANTRSAAKEARKAVRRRTINRARMVQVKSTVKAAIAAIKAGDLTTANPAVSAAHQQLDKAVKGGQIHRNKAARLKSRLSVRLNVLRYGGPKPQAA